MGKYGSHYGPSHRKMVKKTGINQHAKYTCSFCGKTNMKNPAVGIWHCGSYVKAVVGEDLDLQHHFRSHSEVCHQKTEGTERIVETGHLRLAINGVIYMTKNFIMAL